MKILHQKLRKLARRLSRERGDFILFGVFQETEGSGNWDVIISAAWVPKSILDATRLFVDEAVKDLTNKEMRMLTGLYVKRPDSPFVQEAIKRFPTDPLGKARELKDIEIAGIRMNEAVIFVAQDDRTKTGDVLYQIEYDTANDIKESEHIIYVQEQ